MRAPELLTCPFCGSNDVDNKRADARYHCYRCGADGPQIPYAPDDKAWTWQTRATQPDPRDEVIAEAEARGMRRAAALARQALVDGAYIKRGSHQETPSSVMFLAETLVSNAILAAIPKGGDA